MYTVYVYMTLCTLYNIYIFHIFFKCKEVVDDIKRCNIMGKVNIKFLKRSNSFHSNLEVYWVLNKQCNGAFPTWKFHFYSCLRKKKTRVSKTIMKNGNAMWLALLDFKILHYITIRKECGRDRYTHIYTMQKKKN